MKKGSVALLLLWISLTSPVTYCQEKIYLSSDQFVNEGIELHNKGEYDKAIACYQKVSKCDPNYEMACYEMALTYYYIDKYDEALAKCREAQSLNYDKAYLYSLMGSILDETGRQNEGIELLNSALKKWPYNQNILYNLAVCYLNTGRPLEAEGILIKSILINPYHNRTHLALAKANYQMGRIAQSYLAYNMALLLNPSVSNIAAFEEAISQKPKLKIQEYKYPYAKDVNPGKWDELKDLLQSELAFRNEFDYDFEYNYTVGRQSLMLFRKLTFDPADTSIYNRLYARLFVDIYQKTGFETYLNYILKNTNNDGVAKWSDKNQDKLKAFVSWAQAFINQGRLYCFSYQDEQNSRQTYHYDEDGNLVSIGELSARNGNIKNGPWLIISNYGDISEKGVYVNGKAQGEWLVYWPDGTLRNHLNFKDDLLDGKIQTFHPNGAVDRSYLTRSGKKAGINESYSHSGLLINRNSYSDDKAEGPGIFNSYKEGFVRKYNYTGDSLENEATETWLNGNQKQRCTYHRGMLEGTFTSWYSNGSKESERNYKHDTLVGKYSEYYPNGQKSREYEYNTSGNLTGKIISYDRPGKITAEENEYKEGKLTGTRTEFFPDGRIQRILTYQNDHLLQFQCFDEKGNQLCISHEADSSIYFRSFYPDGILSAEGLLSKDRREGKWKFFNPLGILTDESNYSNGQFEGPQHTYYENGQAEKVYSCHGNYILGEYREYYINGHLKLEGNYDSTGIAGKWLYYFRNDTLSNIVFYKEGKASGRSSSYYATGKLRSEEFFNSDCNSIRSREFEEDGSLTDDLNFEYGTHAFEIMFPDGKLKEKKTLSDNVMDGVYETYYPNGRLATQIEYYHNSMNGNYRKWDYEGNLTYSIPYLLDKAEGDVKWFKNNTPDYSAHYEQDKVQGKTTGYHYNGQKARESAYVDDKRNGNSDFYSPEGIFMYRLRYADNTIKGYSYQDKSGNMVQEIPITDTTGKITTYYPNGKISSVISLSMGLYHGKFTAYYSSGSLLREETFKFGENEGYDKTYYPGNKLRELINYTADSRQGLYELYYENGKKEKTGNYCLDNEEGDWIVYKPDGSIREKLKYRNGILYEIR